MDAQNIERRDSKKSNKNNGGGAGGYKSQNRGVGAGGGSSSNGTGGAGEKPLGEKQRSHSQKSGKPYREIYKPPSMRSTKNRNSNSFNDQDKGKYNDDRTSSEGNPSQSKKVAPMNNGGGQFSKSGIGGGNNGNRNGSSLSSSSSRQQNESYSNDGNGDSHHHMNNIQNSYSLFGNEGNGSNGSNGSNSVPSSPLISSRMQQNAFNLGLANRMLNVNAKEFQFLPIQQQHQQQQQISNFLREFDPSLFYNNASPILANSGCYPLKQSKSSGNMNLLIQQQQQQQAQIAALQQLQQQLGFTFPLQHGDFSAAVNSQSSGINNGGGGQFNRLSQSKSSGNVPGGRSKPCVRFDDEEPDFDDVDDFVGSQLGNYLASLKLNADVNGMSGGPHFPRNYPFNQQQQQQQQQHQPSQNKAVPSSPQSVLKSSLQKSRTGFYLNLYGNPQQPQMSQTSPTKPIYGFGNSPSGNNSLHQQASNYPSKVTTASAPGQQFSSFQGTTNVVKRSRSFGPGTHHLPRVSAASLFSASHQSPSSAGHSIYSDFCIMKWPRAVQELVTAAVTGVDRIPARNWIEMVNGIFEAMLCDFRPTKKDRIFSTSQSGGITTSAGSNKMSGAAASSSINKDEGSSEMSNAGVETSVKCQRNGECGGDNASSALSDSPGKNNDLAISPDVDDTEDNDEEEDEDDDDDDDTDLTSAAVHIFLYFIQREKDRTVMESLLNTCFASFQRLSSISLSSSSSSSPSTKSGKSQLKRLMAEQIGKPSVSRQWSNFLRFLSTLYSQVKLIRRQTQSQQQPGQSMDEMRFSLLALLCDSCLATLRSPQSYTAEMMGCLFTVLTSIGRDMEGTFPLKMKQLLAAVRDALLGIGPYHQQQQHHYLNNGSSSSTSSSAPSSRSSGLSPIVQKTLMQLIELHAANWQLPASAVRYYYSSVNGGSGGGGGNSKSMMSSAAHVNNSSGSSPSVGNATTQKPNTNNNYSNSNSDKHGNHNPSASASNNGRMVVASAPSASSKSPLINKNNDGTETTGEDKNKGNSNNDDGGSKTHRNDTETEEKEAKSAGGFGLVDTSSSMPSKTT